MNRTVDVMRILAKDKWSWFYLPWMILFFNFVINLVIGISIGKENPNYAGGIASLYLAMLIIAIVVIGQMFPFALGLSVRRMDFFLGTTGLTFIVSAAGAVVLLFLSLLEQWTHSWGVNLHFFHLPYLNDGSAVEQLLVYFILMLNMTFLGFTVSSVFRRFGGSGLLIFFAIVFVLGSVGSLLCTYYGWWLDIFYWVADHTAFTLAMWTVPLVIIYMLVSYLFLRKATV